MTEGRRVPVLLMVRELTLGGTERQLCEMALTLDRRRFEPHVAAFRPQGIRADDLRKGNVPILGVPLQSFRSPWKAVRALQDYVRLHDIRVVHAFDPPSCLLLSLAWPFLGNRVRLTSQRNHQQVRTPLVRMGLRLAHRLSNGVVVNCEAMREHLVRDEHLRPERIHLCYNGLDTSRFRRSATPPAGIVPSDALVAGALCALRPEKNLTMLLEAFAACRAVQPRLFLLIVGSGPELPRLQAHAAALGIADRCHFQPMVADVVPWLSLMDIFVLTSQFEALPNALMEAMACGCAVISSRVGGTPELVTPGETGFLFDKNDGTALKAHLERLAGDADLRRQVSAAAAERMRLGFSLEASASRLGEIYDERLAASRGAAAR